MVVDLTQIPGVHLNSISVKVSGVLTGVRGPFWVVMVVAGVLVQVSGVLVSCGWVVDLLWVPPCVAGGLAWVPGVRLNGFFGEVFGVSCVDEVEGLPWVP